MHAQDHDVYNLYGYIIHEGAQSRKGHYTSVVKGLDDKWYECNDLQVTEYDRSITKKDTENAYMLFYQKQASAKLSPTSTANGSSLSLGKAIDQQLNTLKDF
jgi:Ubiquitin carboxyl-terminal hydrolase